MKWIADIKAPIPMHFEILHDEAAGYYIYVYQDGRGTHDYLQDTLEIAKDFSFRKFEVPLDAWRQVE